MHSPEEAVLDYDDLNRAVMGAEKRRGKAQVMECLDGVYRVEFLIEEKVRNLWVRKVKVIAKKGFVNQDLLGLMAHAFKVPLSEFHRKSAADKTSVEIFGEA